MSYVRLQFLFCLKIYLNGKIFVSSEEQDEDENLSIEKQLSL